VPIVTGHLASLSRQTIEIGPNEFGRLSEEMADGLSICAPIDIPTELLMTAYMDSWDDGDKGEKKIYEIREILNESPVQIHDPDTHSIIAESLRRHLVLGIGPHPQSSSHPVIDATVSKRGLRQSL
jgi:hypothetical protein